MARIPRLNEAFLTVDTLLRTGPGFVFSLTIGFQSAAAGQRLVLRDGTTNTASPLAIFVLGAANGTITKEWDQGKAFLTGLYVDFEGAAAPAIQMEITYQ